MLSSRKRLKDLPSVPDLRVVEVLCGFPEWHSCITLDVVMRCLKNSESNLLPWIYFTLRGIWGVGKKEKRAGRGT